MSCCDTGGPYDYLADQTTPTIDVTWLDAAGKARDLTGFTGYVEFVHPDTEVLVHTANGVTCSNDVPPYSLQLTSGDIAALSDPIAAGASVDYEAYARLVEPGGPNKAGPIIVTVHGAFA